MIIFTNSITLNLLEILTAVLVVFITFVKWRYSYWKRVGLESLDPKIPYGDIKKLLTKQLSSAEQFNEIYNEFKSRGLRHGGVYVGLKPQYMPVDPVIIKHIMQADFPHFVNHGIHHNERDDPLSAHLFSLEDAKWRNLRMKLTPTFTSGKMKMMFHTLAECAVGLKDIMDNAASSGTDVDIKEILGRFSTDIIGSVAFGLECNSLKDPDAEFRKYGRRVFEVENRDRILHFSQFFLPRSAIRALRLKFTKPDVEKFFMQAVKEIVEYREKNNVYRKDFMHLLLQLKNRGKVSDDEKITDSEGNFGEKALTMNELAAQAFVFFLAGFETSSTTMTWALYELAINPDVQVKLREEINKALEKHNNQITYEGIMEMTYMQQVIEETLRKYPPVPNLPRICTKDYVIPGTNIRLEKGTAVSIPVVGIHNDPEYYPEPKKFDPDRFTEENKRKRPAFTWIPFGEGPRMCIGMRFGLLQSKVGLTTLLKNYHITLNKKTKYPVKLDKVSFVTSAEGGIWLDVKKIE